MKNIYIATSTSARACDVAKAKKDALTQYPDGRLYTWDFSFSNYSNFNNILKCSLIVIVGRPYDSKLSKRLYEIYKYARIRGKRIVYFNEDKFYYGDVNRIHQKIGSEIYANVEYTTEFNIQKMKDTDNIDIDEYLKIQEYYINNTTVNTAPTKTPEKHNDNFSLTEEYLLLTLL